MFPLRRLLKDKESVHEVQIEIFEYLLLLGRQRDAKMVQAWEMQNYMRRFKSFNNFLTLPNPVKSKSNLMRLNAH